jgi:hypothetical protein
LPRFQRSYKNHHIEFNTDNDVLERVKKAAEKCFLILKAMNKDVDVMELDSLQSINLFYIKYYKHIDFIRTCSLSDLKRIIYIIALMALNPINTNLLTVNTIMQRDFIEKCNYIIEESIGSSVNYKTVLSKVSEYLICKATEATQATTEATQATKCNTDNFLVVQEKTPQDASLIPSSKALEVSLEPTVIPNIEKNNFLSYRLVSEVRQNGLLTKDHEAFITSKIEEIPEKFKDIFIPNLYISCLAKEEPEFACLVESKWVKL